MAKNKVTDPEILDEEIREEEQPLVKGPLRDDPEPAYTPAWQVVNRRQDVYSDKLPPKIFSIEAMIAAGVVNEENLAAYLVENGYVKNTDYASTSVGGVIKTNTGVGTQVNTNGLLNASARTLAQYPDDGVGTFIGKGTLENIKEDLIARALVGIGEAQITTPVAGTYTVKLTYDGAAWGVTIIQDT